mmetsp:Transcript_22213/g.61642  ORF Transcript_22213/g.61642 Transcript_22213/m.61642 type:complete len:99 (-) Transcript_22213:204-500(-)
MRPGLAASSVAGSSGELDGEAAEAFTTPECLKELPVPGCLPTMGACLKLLGELTGSAGQAGWAGLGRENRRNGAPRWCLSGKRYPVLGNLAAATSISR